MRIGMGAYTALAATVMAFAGLLLLYGALMRVDSWPAHLGALVIVGLDGWCTYYLAQLARFVLEMDDPRAWRRSKIHTWLLAVVIAYGGLIPWMAYLTINGHPVAWWGLVFCLPFYLAAVWYGSREFRRGVLAAALSD